MGQNEELVRRIQDGELYLMGKLWEDNQGLVKHIAGRYRESCGRLFDIADLMQAGYLGLHTARWSTPPSGELRLPPMRYSTSAAL